MTLWKPVGLVAAMGLLAGISVLAVTSFPFRLGPDSAGWPRLVKGVSAKGNVDQRAVVLLPGINRRSAPNIFIDFEQEPLARATLAVSVDQGPVYQLPSDSGGTASLTLPRATNPGARLDIFRLEGTPVIRLRSLSVTPTASPAWNSILAASGLASALTLVFLVWRGRAVATGLGLCSTGLLTLAYSPAMVFLLFPDRPSSLRVLLIGGLLLTGFEAGRRLETGARPSYWLAVALLIAAVFGSWVRVYFLPSAGSWDVEFWQAWTARATSHGITRVYGDPDAVPPEHFLSQLRGEEPLWEVQSRDRSFLIDYPPLAMVAWRLSWGFVQSLPLPLDRAEARNVAAKLPAVAGDVAIVAILLWLFRHRPRRAAVLAALFWALPISWLSSAVLGFQDQTYSPLVMVAVIAAGRSHALSAGALLVMASMTKLLGAVATPSVLVALLANQARLRKTIGRATAGAAGVTLIVLLPFTIAGTLPAMVVQIVRQLVPGNLSSGYPNPWWIYGHLANLATVVTDSIAGPVSRLLLSDVSFAAGSVGTAIFALVLAWICWQQYRFPGTLPALLSSATVFLAYATFSVGVFENHPHVAFPLLFGIGLGSRRLKILCTGAMTSYTLNLLLHSGLGRLYGTRYMLLERLASGLSELRMAAGFDLTLLLAGVNTVVMVVLLAILPRELETLQQSAKRRSE